jgi:two-component system chemotaxis response regulator CheB
MAERPPVRVLVVDDSAVMRKLLPAALSRDRRVQVVATAVDGETALRKLERLRPDVVTLDLEMPRMHGLEVLREMVARHEIPVLVVSAHTGRDAALSVAALEMGAVDVVAKPASVLSGGLEAMAQELLSKLVAVGGRRWRRPEPPRPSSSSGGGAVRPRRVLHGHSSRIVAIGASTGGPAALAYLLPRLPSDLAAAVVVVQHMPEGFTALLAERLDRSCGLEVKEAQDGDVLRNGRVLIAPGGRHLRVRRLPRGPVALVGAGPAVSGHCPSADVMFESVAAEFGAHTVGVLLTGMGEDGAEGLQSMHRALGRTLGQDEESCVVFGMPRAAILRGAVDQVLPLERIPEAIVAEVTRQLRTDQSLDFGRLSHSTTEAT